MVIDFRRTAEFHFPEEDPTPITRDVDDHYLVRLGRTAKADYLVTGDRDLLESSVEVPVIIKTDKFAREVLPNLP